MEAARGERAAPDSPAGDLEKIPEAPRASFCSDHSVGDSEDHQEGLPCHLRSGAYEKCLCVKRDQFILASSLCDLSCLH